MTAAVSRGGRRGNGTPTARGANDGVSAGSGEQPQSAAALDTKRAAILAAVAELVAAKGYAGMTTLDVARAANISKRDLYARFPSKDDLIVGLISDGVRDMLVPVDTGPIGSRADFYSCLHAFGERFLADMLSTKRIRFYRVVITEVSRTPDIGRTLLREGQQATIARIGALFGEAQARGYVRFASVDAAVGIFFFALMGDHMMTCLLDPDRVIGEGDRQRYVGLALMAVRALDQIRDSA